MLSLPMTRTGGAATTGSLGRRATSDAASTYVRGHSSLASRDACFLAAELVRGAGRVCSFAALARDLADAVTIHRGKTAAAWPALFRRGVGFRLR
jgi:hypothetical protein